MTASEWEITFLQTDFCLHLLPVLREKGVDGNSVEELLERLANAISQPLARLPNQWSSNRCPDSTTAMPHHAAMKPPATTSQDNRQSIGCIKSNRKCQTRSTFCELGSHCDKLSEAEIDNLERNKCSNYQCEMCQKYVREYSGRYHSRSRQHQQQRASYWMSWKWAEIHHRSHITLICIECLRPTRGNKNYRNSRKIWKQKCYKLGTSQYCRPRGHLPQNVCQLYIKRVHSIRKDKRDKEHLIVVLYEPTLWGNAKEGNHWTWAHI